MKTRLLGVSGLTLHVVPPNEVTDSKHAKLIKGIGRHGIYGPETDPFHLAGEFLNMLSANDGTGTLSYIISETLTRFPKSDFLRFGDPNCISQVSRAWFSETGTHIDVQSDIISLQHNKDIGTNEIIDHVMTYKQGQYMQPLASEIESLLVQFRTLFSFNLTVAYARFLVGDVRKDYTLPF